MGIRFKCHHCQAPLNIKTELANKRGVCPECLGKFRIPGKSQDLSSSLDEQVTITGASSDTPKSGATTNEPLYFVRPPSGGEYGPAGLETIELWISQRRITGETLVCRIGSAEWKKAKEVFTNHFVLG